MQVEKVYLKGDSSKGRFSDGFVFEFNDYYGEQKEGFFHKSTIRGNFLEVSVLEEKGDKVSIVLPQNDIEDRHNMTVNKSSLTYGKLN